MTPIFYGQVKNGRLALDKRDKFQKYLLSLNGAVQLRLEKIKNIRTLAENRYYWGVIVKMVSDAMAVIPDHAHEFLKALFLKSGVDFKGKRYTIVRSTASLSVKEFEEYCEQCRAWAASELETAIPLPNEISLDDY